MRGSSSPDKKDKAPGRLAIGTPQTNENVVVSTPQSYSQPVSLFAESPKAMAPRLAPAAIIDDDDAFDKQFAALSRLIEEKFDCMHQQMEKVVTQLQVLNEKHKEEQKEAPTALEEPSVLIPEMKPIIRMTSESKLAFRKRRKELLLQVNQIVAESNNDAAKVV